MEREVNLNYGATSPKKPEASINAMIKYLSENNQNNPGRGGEASLNEGRLAIDARIQLCRLFNVKKPEQIIFTANVTMSLNMVINGLVKQGDHVITTSMEHNGAARPLELLKNQGIIDLTYIQCSEEGFIDPEDVRKNIRKNTAFMVMIHASNVTGTILDYEGCARICRENNIAFVLDAAQSAGYLNIDFENSDIDVLAFTGHKSLLGPTGTGGFVLKEHMKDRIKPFMTGGTGSISHELIQPDFLPDKFESGTPNVLGLIGLGKSVEYINEIGLERIYAHETMLTGRFLEGLENLPVRIYGPKVVKCQVPVVSITAEGWDQAFFSQLLYENYRIVTRPGLHCSPLAHKTIRTYPEGTVRFSFGWFTETEEVEYALDSLRELLL